MYVYVERLYRDGALDKRREPPVAGKLLSDDWKNGRASVLNLWPLEWVENAKQPHLNALAVLWQPVLLRVGVNDILIAGLEARERNSVRQWVAQKWRCEVTTLDLIRQSERWEKKPHARSPFIGAASAARRS